MSSKLLFLNTAYLLLNDVLNVPGTRYVLCYKYLLDVPPGTRYVLPGMVRVIMRKSHLNSNRFSGTTTCCVQNKEYEYLLRAEQGVPGTYGLRPCKSTFTRNTGTGWTTTKSLSFSFSLD